MAALVMMIYLLESLFSTAWSLVWKQTGFRELEAKYWPKAAGGKHAPLGCVVGKRRNDPSSREKYEKSLSNVPTTGLDNSPSSLDDRKLGGNAQPLKCLMPGRQGYHVLPNTLDKSGRN